MWVRVIMGMTPRFWELEKAEERCEIGNTVLFEKRLYYVFSLQMNTLTWLTIHVNQYILTSMIKMDSSKS